MEQSKVITRAKDIMNTMEVQNAPIVKIKLVQQVMKEQFHMTYRKILKLAPTQNSDQNIILRQQWAIAYLELIKTKKL